MEEPDKSELVIPKRTRRIHSKAFKAKLVAMADSVDQSVSQIAIDHKLNTNQLRKWMSEARKLSAPDHFLPVSVQLPNHENVSKVTDTPVMELSVSGAVLRFHSSWDPVAVATLIKSVQ